jgi:hypothetical protein
MATQKEEWDSSFLVMDEEEREIILDFIRQIVAEKLAARKPLRLVRGFGPSTGA